MVAGVELDLTAHFVLGCVFFLVLLPMMLALDNALVILQTLEGSAC